MFDVDRWQEILDTLRKNKLRAALTAVSVAWGIFMLVILLGAGNGLQNGFQNKFADDATNSIWISGGETSLPHNGQGPGRSIQFRNGDYEFIRTQVEGVDHITARFEVQGELLAGYGDKHAPFDVRSVHPDHRFLEKTLITRGRFINEFDLERRTKVAAVGVEVVKQLFGDVDPMGEWLDLSGIKYRVVGVFEDEGGEGEMSKIYIPISTAQMAYGGGDKIDQVMFTVGDATAAEATATEQQVLGALAAHHNYSPDDDRAVWSRNNLEGYQRMTDIFSYIRVFIWLVGIGTIIAGIVGVGNIMLISVKERTKEIGIRKAVGATPSSIVALILQEALLITTVSGYIGLVMGVGLLELVGKALPANDIFQNPQVDLRVAISATVLLVLCGAIAGFVPARRAARVNPIEALRDE